ncbi:MAG: hypothetical protein KAU06_05820, partial [Candidatus Marinimicrobia bacterium]|nr:hypothetical protein [Candidatus Neomarinimicrobiota bacterium]
GPVACQNNNGQFTNNEGRIIAGGVDLDHPPRTVIYLSTPMTNLVIGGWTTILFDAIESDSDSQADIPNNRIIIKYTGTYIVIASCRWSGGINPAASRMSAQILRNGATIDVDDSHASLNTYLRNPNHRIKNLTAGDLITAQARPFTAGNTADIQAGQNVTNLQVHRLS